MTLTELHTLLAAVPGLGPKKVAHRAFPEGLAPELPYVTYLEQRTDPFHADNRIYYAEEIVDIELYSVERDSVIEAAVEDALSGTEAAWSKDTEYLDSEKCYETIYTVSI